MASVAARGLPRRSLLGRLAAAAGDGRLGRLAARARGLVLEHGVTVAAFTALDYGMFGIGAGHHAAGWAVTSLTALLLDWKVRD